MNFKKLLELGYNINFLQNKLGHTVLYVYMPHDDIDNFFRNHFNNTDDNVATLVECLLLNINIPLFVAFEPNVKSAIEKLESKLELIKDEDKFYAWQTVFEEFTDEIDFKISCKENIEKVSYPAIDSC